MKRRELLAALTIAGLDLEAQPTPDSLYIPKPQLVEDRKLLQDFMDEFAFIDLVTAAPDIRITHIPSMLDRTAGKYGTIFGHIARQNPQSKTFDGRERAVVVFRGPHAYISPLWYAKSEVVPTWNFAVVHASGKLKPIEDQKALHDLLAKLIQKFEGPGSAYAFAKLTDTYKYGLIKNIIGFQMEIELLEGKFKLGQERNEADRQGILKGLQSRKPERTMPEFAASFYQRS
jgi:transcriptional regulator